MLLGEKKFEERIAEEIAKIKLDAALTGEITDRVHPGSYSTEAELEERILDEMRKEAIRIVEEADSRTITTVRGNLMG